MKRILSLDGGGIKGVFPAAFLAAIEQLVGRKIGDFFDLIVGTSTGGIIALGLGLGFSAQEILSFYEEEGPSIFGGSRMLASLRWLGVSKYSQTPLRSALERRFGDLRLGDACTRLVIPSLNLETGAVHVFKTSHHPRFVMDFRERAVDVALATAAAPTYFPTHHLAVGTPLVDGGMWANNPVGVAVVEAIGVLRWPAEELQVLSLGCTTPPLNVSLARRIPLGLTYWGLKVAEVFMAGQSSASIGTAQLLAGDDRVLRISPRVPGGRFGLDMVSEIPALRGLGFEEARYYFPKLHDSFFRSPAEPFEPYHSNRGTISSAEAPPSR